MILSGGKPIAPEDLPRAVTRPGARPGGHAVKFSGGGKVRTLREVEMEVILDTLEKHDGDKPKTASELGIALKTLYNKLNQYQAQHQSKAG